MLLRAVPEMRGEVAECLPLLRLLVLVEVVARPVVAEVDGLVLDVRGHVLVFLVLGKPREEEAVASAAVGLPRTSGEAVMEGREVRGVEVKVHGKGGRGGQDRRVRGEKEGRELTGIALRGRLLLWQRRQLEVL